MPAAMMHTTPNSSAAVSTPTSVRSHGMSARTISASIASMPGACAQPQQQHTRAAEQRDRKHKTQKAVRAERAEILPQFLSGHIPRAEKAPGKGQTQPQSTDFPLHTIFLPMTTAKIDDTEYSIYCVQFQDAAA